VDSTLSGYDAVAGSCGGNNEPLGSLTYEKFLD
jgi:hypothetical protein